MPHTAFASTTRGLDRDHPVMLLFERAKQLGTWNPSAIDLSRDKADWAALKEDERDILLRLTAMFVAGEEAVTLDLLPLIQAIAGEGRIEEELYLTTFLWEEAKHVDFFNRVLREVFDAPTDLTAYQSDNYKAIVYEALPDALDALRADPSPRNQARASAVYNMMVEGMLAETGYHGYFTIIDRHDILPGVREGVAKLKLDESRHIAYGVFLLSRLMAEDPELWPVIEETMNGLFPSGLAVISDIISPYEPVPFGITLDEFTAYGASQFQKRFQRIMKARDASLADLRTQTRSVIEAEDG